MCPQSFRETDTLTWTGTTAQTIAEKRLVDVAFEVNRARQAQPHWAALPIHERLAILKRARHALPAVATKLDALVHAGRRAPGETMGAEVVPLADALRFLEKFAAKILRPRKVGARSRPLWLQGVNAKVHREPFGVILIIGPSNYPLFLPGVQAIQALAAGNAVVWKPGTGGEAVAHAFVQVLFDAGLDKNLVRVLPETPEAGVAAIEAGVDKVLVTGSARTGAKVLGQLAPQLIPATLELSGCDPTFVQADADLDLVTRALGFGFRFNHAETCIAPHRIFVHHSVAAELKKRLVSIAGGLQSIESKSLAARAAAGLIQDAMNQGAQIIAGRILPGQEGITPTVVAQATPDMALLKEDLFSPVVALVEVSDDEDSLRAASQCPYALGASVFGGSASADALAQKVRAGGVVINDVIAPTADPRLPFGGRGRSGYGVTRGEEGLLDVTTIKVISTRTGGSTWHLDPPEPNDARFFELYIRAMNTPSWKEWCGAWVSLIPLLIRKLRGAGKSQPSETPTRPK